MSEAFDPDKYLVEKTGAAFDPDKYLAEKAGTAPAQTKDAPVTLGAGATGALHFARHASFGLGDKITAGVQALSDVFHDKSGKVTLSDAFNRDLGFNDKLLEASDAEHPLARWLGNIAGFGLSSAALAAPTLFAKGGAAAAQALPRALALRQASKEGVKLGAVVGGAGGFGGSRADSALGTLGDTTLGSILGAVSGGAGPYVADAAGRGSQYLGGKARDLAGWLKVNSIHPTPLLGEAMDDLPGGAPAVGRELLSRGIGGWTQADTAQQVGRAFGDATGVANELASNHAATGASVDVGQALAAARAQAEKLIEEPVTRDAGQKLMSLVNEYSDRYGVGDSALADATEALATKRALGREAYGARAEFKLSKSAVAGDYGKGVGGLERGVDDALDETLGPQFGAANLLVRRLGGAKQAVERAASRTVGNHLIGLLPYLAGLGGAAGGHASGQALPEALAYGGASWLASKYGPQTLARLLYSPVGGGLGLIGRGLQAIPGAVASGAAAEEAAPFAGTLADFLRPGPLSAPLTRYARGDGR